MVNVEVTTEIDRPVHDVFDFVQNEANMPAWDSDLIKAERTSPGPMGLGSTFHLDIKPFMGATEGTGEVVGYEPDKKIELQFRMGRMDPHIWHMFEPTAHGTKFSRRVQISPKGVLKLMTPMMGRMMTKRNQQYLSKLKLLLEQ
jgi:uncharacterized protein YndB with AHSA1/START domain